jgi:hypothetical protein
MDKVALADLPERHAALNFLFPRAFNSLVARGEDRVRARRFILQCVVAMFAEDIGLLPQDIFTHLLDECRGGASSCASSPWTNASSPKSASPPASRPKASSA